MNLEETMQLYQEKFHHILEKVVCTISLRDYNEYLKNENLTELVIFSAYKDEPPDDDYDFDYYPTYGDRIAIHGKCILVQEYEQFWGVGVGRDYKSDVLENPTWRDIMNCANRMIHTTGDKHHVFLEDVIETEFEENGVKIWRFSMGS